MKKMLFSVFAVLVVLGCGGDMGDLPSCLKCVLCGSRDYNPSTEFCSAGTVYSRCGSRDYNPSTEFCSGSTVLSKSSSSVWSSSSFAPSSSSLNQGSSFVYCIIDGMCLDGPYTYNECFNNLRGLPSNSCIVPSSSSVMSSSSFGSSSSSSSSSSAPIFACTMTATAGTVGLAISPAPTATCNGSAITTGLAWTPTNLTPATVGSISVSVSTNSSVCSGMTAQCGSILVFTYSSLPYEGQSYKTIKIGTQTWMAENLNYNPDTGNSACNSNQTSNCVTYGRLYDWSTAMGFPSSCNSSFCYSQIQSPHRGICPAGWHIPNSEDWLKLLCYVDSTSDTTYFSFYFPMAGKYLKATSGWNSHNGTDAHGFSALPGGNGVLGSSSFNDVGNHGSWWSASEYNRNFANTLILYGDDTNSDKAGLYISDTNGNKSHLLSVRCLQD